MAFKLQDALAYPPRGMNSDRAAAYAGFSRSHFLTLVERGVFPEPLDIEGSPRWDRTELDAAYDAIKRPAAACSGRLKTMDEVLGVRRGNVEAQVYQ